MNTHPDDTIPDVTPQQRIGLNVQRARVPIVFLRPGRSPDPLVRLPVPFGVGHAFARRSPVGRLGVFFVRILKLVSSFDGNVVSADVGPRILLQRSRTALRFGI